MNECINSYCKIQEKTISTTHLKAVLFSIRLFENVTGHSVSRSNLATSPNNLQTTAR